MKDELKLVFPTEEFREQMMEYLQEHIDNNEYTLHGAGGLEKLNDFDKWLEKVRNEAKGEKLEEGRVPATQFLAVRKSDNKVIGAIQIRHELNDYLLNYGGHIGDGVRPSERHKGYATEMIRLALIEAKKLGIRRVLMTCDKDNIGSSKSIMNNGGVLENEVLDKDGKVIQRYWISLKKRFADEVLKKKNVIEFENVIKSFENEDFSGDVHYINYIKLVEPHILNNRICIQDDGHKWLEFYDYNSRIKLTVMYDKNKKIVEYYFDIAREIGKENGIPYEDDMYLDVVLTKENEIMNLDEDEFEEAFERFEMTKQEYDEAYKIRDNLVNMLKGNEDKVKEFTDKYLKIFI